MHTHTHTYTDVCTCMHTHIHTQSWDSVCRGKPKISIFHHALIYMCMDDNKNIYKERYKQTHTQTDALMYKFTYIDMHADAHILIHKFPYIDVPTDAHTHRFTNSHL